MAPNWKKLSISTGPRSVEPPPRSSVNHPAIQSSTGQRPDSCSSLSQFSEKDVDELDGWLKRLEGLQSAKPDKISFRPRSSQAHPHLISPTGSLGRSYSDKIREEGGATSSTRLEDPSSSTGSAAASPAQNASSSGPCPTVHIPLLASTSLHRTRSKSLTGTSGESSSRSLGYHSHSPSARPITAVSSDETYVHRHSEVPIVSLSAGTSNSIKRRSVPSPLPLQISLSTSLNAKSFDSNWTEDEESDEDRREDIKLGSPASFSDSTEVEGEGYATVQEYSCDEDDNTSNVNGADSDPDASLNLDDRATKRVLSRLESPESPESPVNISKNPEKVESSYRAQRKMASPLSARFDRTSTISSSHSIKSATTSASGGNKSVDTSSRSSVKLQPRSPFTHSSDWRRRRFGASDETSLDANEDEFGSKSRNRGDYVTAAEAIREMVNCPSQDSLPLQERRPQVDAKAEDQGASNSRQSIESRASSSASHRPWVRVNKTSSGGASSATHSSPISAPRRPKLEARDDRALIRDRPLRPRFNSSRSASFLPLKDDLDDRRSPSPSLGKEFAWNEADDSDDDESVTKDKRRASVSSTSQLYSSAEGARQAAASRSSSSASNRHRVNLAVPAAPGFTRSQSYDHVSRYTDLLGSTSKPAMVASSSADVDYSVAEYKHNCWVWINATTASSLDPSSSKSFSTSSSSHAKSFSKVILGNVPGKKKVQKRDSTQFPGMVGSPSMPNFPTAGDVEIGGDAKGKGKDKSVGKSQIESHWKKCEARLKPGGLLTFYTADTDARFVMSVNVTSLRRTDIRPVDQSLFGRQRCIGLHLKGTGTYPMTEQVLNLTARGATPSHFPSSPSAPNFTALRSAIPVARTPEINYAEQHRKLASSLGPPQPIYLCFSSTALAQAWLVALQNHTLAEVYPHPSRAASLTSLSNPVCELDSDDDLEDDDLDFEGTSNTSSFTSSIMASPKSTISPRRRAATARRQYAVDKLSPWQRYSIRPCRSIDLQIIEARSVKQREPTLTSSGTMTALANLANAPNTGLGPNHGVIQPDVSGDVRRTPSIASGSAGSTKSIDDISQLNQNATISVEPTNNLTSMPLSPSIPSVQSNLSALASSGASFYSNGRRTGEISQAQKEKEEKEKQDAKKQTFCEVWVDGEPVARTALSKSGQAPVWQESFRLSHLGPFNSPVLIHVCQINRAQVSILGSVSLPVQTFRRNHTVEEWFPIVPKAEASRTTCLEAFGEMSLSVRVQEDMVLPGEGYAELDQMLKGDEDCKLIYSLVADPNIEVEDIVQLLLRINIAHDRVLARLGAMAEREVSQSEGNAAILFRGNTLMTKSVELYLRTVGVDFLESSIGEVVRQICREKVEVEIDPSRLQAGVGKDGSIGENVQELEKWTKLVWDAIYNNRNNCPSDLRRLVRQIQATVEDRFQLHASLGSDEVRRTSLSDGERYKMRFTSVSAFIFLRFFGPAVLNPRLFGLCASHPPDSRTQRTLTLIAKTLQGLANMATFGAKEPWMSAMNPFLQSHMPDFEDFISYLCSPPTSGRAEWTVQTHHLYNTPLGCREKLLNEGIVREAVPGLPFLIDLPRELAVFTSVVAKCYRPSENPVRIEDEKPHTKLVELCYSLQTRTRARMRSLERTGELCLSGHSANRQLVARAEPQTRANSTRNRGTTISRATFGTSSIHTTPPRSANPLHYSSPASNHSISPNQTGDSLTSLMNPLSLSASAGQSAMSTTKRRSYTISGAVSSGSPETLSSKLVSEKKPALALNFEDDIIDITLPPDFRTNEAASIRRTTVTRPRFNTTVTSPDLPTSSSTTSLATTESNSLRSRHNPSEEGYTLSHTQIDNHPHLSEPITPKAFDASWRIQQDMARYAFEPSLGLEHEYAAQEAAAEAARNNRKTGAGAWLRRKARGEKDNAE